MQAHILIIDDDLKLTALITKFLENHSYKVSSFDNPKNALEALGKKNDFELIILDITLPEMDGFQVLREISAFFDSILSFKIFLFEITFIETSIRKLFSNLSALII